MWGGVALLTPDDLASKTAALLGDIAKKHESKSAKMTAEQGAARAAGKKKSKDTVVRDDVAASASTNKRKKSRKGDDAATPAAAAASSAAAKKKKSSHEDKAAGPLPTAMPYAADEADHAETPLVAYEDVAPILRWLARSLSKTPAELRIWDPFFCTGAAAKRLAAVGFPHVHHRCEDFFAILASGPPAHDILLTNPPYSSDHLERLFTHCAASAKPWALLLPWYVVKKPWFRCHADAHTVLYLVPKRRYFFLPPAAMVDEGRERVTAPFETFWYLSLGAAAEVGDVVASWRAEHGVDASNASDTGGEAGDCRMGVGFKKRKGTPGFHTLLDANGLLIGRPVPEGWGRS